MADSIIISGVTKEEKYGSLLPQLNLLVAGETDLIANLSNLMAALKQGMNYYWVGVYFVKDEALVLGPFQGTVACTRIAHGKGVCGTAWANREIILVEDVDAFPGHIACSSLSRSEIVLPAFDKKGNVFLVLDIDSDKLADFDTVDKKYLQQVIKLIETLYN